MLRVQTYKHATSGCYFLHFWTCILRAASRSGVAATGRINRNVTTCFRYDSLQRKKGVSHNAAKLAAWFICTFSYLWMVVRVTSFSWQVLQACSMTTTGPEITSIICDEPSTDTYMQRGAFYEIGYLLKMIGLIAWQIRSTHASMKNVILWCCMKSFVIVDCPRALQCCNVIMQFTTPIIAVLER